MSIVPLHPPARNIQTPPAANPLPLLLHTPSGLALLELQGTINLPAVNLDVMDAAVDSESYSRQTPVGRLVFPNYHPELDPDSTAWMKRVHLYVGKHQRLTGEVKKLPKALAIIRKRETLDTAMTGTADDDEPRELEIVDIVKYKLMFSHRPEPVG